MKKYIKIYALLAMALFVGACEDELGNSFEPVQIVSGEEIIFGASYRSASADKAPADRTTRTAYGETNADKNWIEINWIPGYDRMQIASPQSAGVANGVAEYKVQASEDSETNGGESKVTELVRAGAAGLQWGAVENGTTYDFYAVYPSVNQLKESSANVAADGCSLSKEGVLKGYLPTDQTCTDIAKVTIAGERWSFSPEMNYAYMVAKSSYTVDSFDDEGAAFMDNPINLEFESLVTALQFEIKAGDLSLPNTSNENNKIEIISVAVFSQRGDQLAGNFEYDIKADGTEDEGLVPPGTTTYSQVIQKFNGFGTPVTLNNEDGSALDLTFFLLPSVKNYASGDLKLQVVYVIDGVTQIKTATIGTEIPARVKRYFKDVVLPSHTTGVDASVWFQALNPNVLVSQVSIPVAANTFANSKYNVTDQYRTQQSLTIEEMWNLGVRGFEMVNRAHHTDDVLGNMVASESEQANAGTFAANVKILRNKQLLTFTYDDEGNLVAGDPLILLCTYSAVQGGYSPDLYVKKLFASLSALVDEPGNNITKDDFVQLTANSTVKDVMGKICVIVRPGDDERWAQTSDYDIASATTINTTDISPYGYTYSLKNFTDLKESDWWSKVLVISDWGMDSWDSWHRRFGEENYYKYATTKTNFDRVDSSKLKSQATIEPYIIGESSPFPTTGAYYYSHDLSNGHIAYVQDMVRVVKEQNFKATKTTEVGIIGSKTYTHTVNWPESLSEKKKAIRGLFELSVDTKGGSHTDDIYINNLSGYFVTVDRAVSWYPAYYIIVRGGLGNASSKEVFENNSKGGNYKDCADALTEYVYGVLSGDANLSGEETKLAEGPWGLVMMDYIGSAKKSKELVNLILMNNFAGFELAEKQDQNNESKIVKVTLNEEKVNPEAEVFVTWN